MSRSGGGGGAGAGAGAGSSGSSSELRDLSGKGGGSCCVLVFGWGAVGEGVRGRFVMVVTESKSMG